MDLAGTVVVVTGGGNGIGRALCERFAAADVRGVVVADLDPDWARATAEQVTAAGVAALAVGCDVGNRADLVALVDAAERRFGQVDVFCSNAGYSDPAPGDLSGSEHDWQAIVGVNLLAHVWAAQRVVPSMVERGAGYLLQTISSAALITGPSGPGYTTTKHGALGFAEWLTLTYGDRGVRVSCLCPNAVHTGMFGRLPGDDSALPSAGAIGEILTPEGVAETTVAAMTGAEPFLVLPHERVGQSFLRKATDYDGWLAHTRGRLRRMAVGT